MIKKLGIGTVQFGVKYGINNQTGQTSETDAHIILDTALQLGINTLDTASGYGDAEQVLGRYKKITAFNTISKFIDVLDPKGLIEQFEETISNLKVKKLYGYIAHRPLHLLEHPILWETLLTMKQQGKFDKVGYSLNTVDELEILLEKEIIPDLVQVPFNFLDQRFKPYFAELKKLKCEIHTRSTYLQGLLLMPIEKIPEYFTSIKPLLTAINHQTKNSQGALLRYVLNEPAVDKVILGVENKMQLMQNIEALNDAIDIKPHEKKIPDHILIPSLWPKTN